MKSSKTKRETRSASEDVDDGQQYIDEPRSDTRCWRQGHQWWKQKQHYDEYIQVDEGKDKMN